MEASGDGENPVIFPANSLVTTTALFPLETGETTLPLETAPIVDDDGQCYYLHGPLGSIIFMYGWGLLLLY